MVNRRLASVLAASKKSCLLLGPRQVGKSTLFKSLAPEMSINLASESEFFRYSTDPELLETVVREQSPRTVFIDEIQRIPTLLNTIQAILDDSPHPPRFYLSGSSARKLRRGHANLLPGRIFTYHLGGLAASELDYRVNLKKALAHGLLPEPYLTSDDRASEKLLRSYSGTYLKEEIQAESLARNISGFARFLEAMASFSGQICDFSKISSKSKVSRTSCIRFVEILEDTLIAERVSVFERADEADTIKHPKFYFFDVGVLNGLLGNFAVSQDRIGNLFEHFVFNQLRNSAMARDEEIKIEYFRTRHGLEVDFIVTFRGKVWAIEVKSGSVQNSDLESLRAFKRYFPKTHRAIAVSPKEIRRSSRDGILICGWVDLLKELGL